MRTKTLDTHESKPKTSKNSNKIRLITHSQFNLYKISQRWIKNKSFCLILFITIGLIFFEFNLIPKNLALDEVEFTKLSLSLRNIPYTPYSQYATGHPTLYFYILLFSFKVLGITNLALRLPAAVFGLGDAILFYLISKDLFKDERTVFLASLSFVTSRWFFSFARFAFEATFLLFLELFSILLLQKTLQEKRYKKIYLIGTSFFSAAAFNSYGPGRIFFLVPFITLLLFAQKERRVKYLFIFTSLFLLFTLPLNYYFLSHQSFDKRAYQEVFIFSKNLSLKEKVNFFTQNAYKYTQMFLYRGDPNGRHNYPLKAALNPILSLAFLIGLSISIKHIKKKENTIFILLFFISLLPAFLTYPWENPNMLRTYVVLPSVFYFIGIFINNSLKKIKTSFTLLLLIIMISSIYEVRTYFKYQKSVFKQSFKINTNLHHLWITRDIFLNHKKILKKY